MWCPADTVVHRRGRQRPTHNTGGGRKKNVSITSSSGDAHGGAASVGRTTQTLRVWVHLLDITEWRPVYRWFCSSGSGDMVIYVDRQRAAVGPRSDSCLPMTGEGTGLEALTSPQAGYLGKVQERAALLESCPWCASKGLTFALRSYRINLQESLTLCTNPQCLFPLVTRPLEDVLASLERVEPPVGNKRKSVLGLEEAIKSPLKRQRRSEDGDLRPQSVCCAPASDERSGSPDTDSKRLNGYQKETPDVEMAEWDDVDIQNGDDPVPPVLSGSVGHSPEVLLTSNGSKPPALSPHLASPDESKQNNVPALNERRRLCSPLPIYSAHIKTPSPLCNEQTASTESEAVTADGPPCRGVTGSPSASRGSSDELVPVPKQLLWRNSDSLCWLDSLLAALVNCRSLRNLGPEEEPQRPSVWRLLREHEEVCAAVQAHQQTGRDGVLRVPRHVLQNACIDLERLRMSVFKLLQPKLHCKLGQKETPVFAMPLLLASDSWVEHLFQTTYLWEFKCSECKVIVKERVVKTLPTFTNIVPDWSPLNAVHFAPCNVCSKKNQSRTMLLESVPPVFALHFVEGLPDNDVGGYSFSFKGRRYSVTTVIQYCHQLKHFVTWIHNQDGSWLEYDDLKEPACETHQRLQIPAQEIHVVFWEAEEEAKPSVCSPSSTLPEPPPAEKEGVPCLQDLSAEEPAAETPDESLLTSHNVTDIVCALSGDASTNVLDTTATADVNTSIGATTLLDAFDGLTHNDIITLTLVELQPDAVQSEAAPSKTADQTESPSAPGRTESLLSSPDSSVRAAGGELSHNADAEHTAASVTSDSESKDSEASDPTFVPGAKRQRGRRANQRKTVGRQRFKKPSSSKDAPQSTPGPPPEAPSPESSPPEASPPEASPPESPPEPPIPVCSAQGNAAPVGEQTSTVSSTNSSPPSSTQSDRWSFLLSKHRLNPCSKNISYPPPTQNPATITEAKSSHLVHSTPNPVRKLPVPLGVPKAPLVTEEGQSLPPKAAEMYGGFGAKSSSPLIPLPSPLSTLPLPPVVPPNHPTPLSWTSGTSPPLLPKIPSLKKPGRSTVPPVLGDTEALRYKLLKKLKAKKKKLAKLNQLLGGGGGPHLRPDSTDLNSPSTVSSSTYDGSTCDDILSDLLSPATTASHLSPDSTDFLEMLAAGQDEADQLRSVANGVGVVSQTNCSSMSQHEDHNFLEEFLSQL
ncbi:SUMO-specific isopeptidase USPL1 [Fundulus diaphanus]